MKTDKSTTGSVVAEGSASREVEGSPAGVASMVSVPATPKMRHVIHKKEGPRHVTVVYMYDPEMETVRYGATIFKKTESGPEYDHPGHLETAAKRFTRHPVTACVPPGEGRHELERSIRRLLFTHGVKSK
jgi:hypothetical protein